MTPALDAAAFNLAVAHFRGPSLRLSHATPAAYLILGIDPEECGSLKTTAADVLITWATADGTSKGEMQHYGRDLRARLDNLAQECGNLGWGEGVDIEYVFRSGPSRELRRATALVNMIIPAPSEHDPSPLPSYSILFLRPASPHQDQKSSELPRSPPLAGAVLSPPTSDPLSRTPAKSLHEASTQMITLPEEAEPSSPPVRPPLSAGPRSDGSCASGKRRLVTAEDRANLPVSPAMRNALASATSQILKASPPSSATHMSPEVSSLDLSDHSSQSVSGSFPSEVAFRLTPDVLHDGVYSSERTPTGSTTPEFRASSETSAEGSRSSSPDHLDAYERGLKLRQRNARAPLTLEQLTKLVENMPQIAFIAAPDGHVLWLSSAWYEYTGQDATNEASNDEWITTFHPDDLEHVFDIYLGALKTGEDFSFEYRIKGKDGHLRWHRCQGHAHRDDDGSISNWFASIVNVDDLVNTRHDALLVNERTKAVLAGSDLTLLTIDTDLRITFFEGKFPPFNFRSDAPTLVGELFHDLCADEDLRESVRKVLDEEEDVVQVQTVTVGNDGGPRYTRYRLVPLLGDPSIPASHPDAEAVAGCIAVGVDVSERIRAEKELEVSRSQAAELKASELAAREASRLKTEFLTTVSHEIRTPIAGILGICELLLADVHRLAKDQRELVEKAVRSGEILLDLVGAVLDFRKVETGELKLEAEAFTLGDVLADASLFSVLAQKKGLEFNQDVDVSYNGSLLGDRLRLRQVLANALGNSVKFTRQGKVTLSLKQLSEDDSQVVVRFVITDTGLGIDKDVLPTLFTPFKQASAGTAREYGGSGLGLVIAKNLVEMMDGSIELYSKLHEGSQMVIIVPFRKAPLAAAKGHIDEEPGAPSSTPEPTGEEKDANDDRPKRQPEDIRILLAEDNELISEIVTRQLRKAGFVVDAVFNGQEAVDQVKQQEFSVVLMDGQMPGVDGYEATKMIRRSSDPHIRELPIVALTASAIAGDRERCLDAGMSTYLAKPVRAKELEETIWQQVELANKRRQGP